MWSKVLILGPCPWVCWPMWKTQHTHTHHIFASGAAVSSFSLHWAFGHVGAAGRSRAAAAVGQRLPLSSSADTWWSSHLWRTWSSPGNHENTFVFFSKLYIVLVFCYVVWDNRNKLTMFVWFPAFVCKDTSEDLKTVQVFGKNLFRGKHLSTLLKLSVLIWHNYTIQKNVPNSIIQKSFWIHFWIFYIYQSINVFFVVFFPEKKHQCSHGKKIHISKHQYKQKRIILQGKSIELL